MVSCGVGSICLLNPRSGCPFYLLFRPAPLIYRALQYFGNDGASRSSKQRSQSPPESKDSGCGSGDEGESDGMSSHGSGQMEVSDAARQIASAMCAAQQLPDEPPQQVRGVN